MNKKTTGIILKRQKIGEADKLLVILTEEMGKVTVLAKGIEKISSRRAGHLEPFMVSQLELSGGKFSRYFVNDVKAQHYFKSLRNNLKKTALASYICELVDRTSSLEEKNTDIFRLLKQTLSLIDATYDDYLINIVRSFEMHLFGLLGFQPELNVCLKCRTKDIPQDVYFSPSEGGIICLKCHAYDKNTTKVSKTSIDTLKFLQNHNLKASLSIDPKKIEKIGNLVNFYIQFILEADLKSKKVIKELKLAKTAL